MQFEPKENGANCMRELHVLRDGYPSWGVQLVFLRELSIGDQPFSSTNAVDNKLAAHVTVEGNWGVAQSDDAVVHGRTSGAGGTNPQYRSDRRSQRARVLLALACGAGRLRSTAPVESGLQP